MELISTAAIETFLASDKDLFSWEPGDDSGLSSSPSTPGATEDTDSEFHLSDYETNLQTNFCDELDACIFDDKPPAKLYTHIKIKEDHEEELWESDISSPTFDNLFFPDDCFGEKFELMDELFTQLKRNNEQEEKPVQKDNVSEEIVSEAATTEATTKSSTCPNICTNIIEEATTAEDSSPEDSEQNPYKRQLRKRVRNNILAEHDYFKSLDETEERNEHEGEEKGQNCEDSEDSDNDFEPPRKASKKSRRSMNPKSDKDVKYWERRKRNNLAAKRSREAKRAREIETAEKTAALEKENANLKSQVRKLKAAIKRAEKRLRVMI